MFVAPCDGVVRALDKATGSLRWTFDARRDGERRSFHGDPLVTEDLFIFGSDGPREDSAGHVHAVERATGKLRWEYPVVGGVASDVVRDGDRLFAVTIGGRLVCLEQGSGRLLWELPSGAPRERGLLARSTPALIDGRVLFGAPDGLAYAVDARSGRPIWSRDLGSPILTPVLVHGSSAYVATADRRIHRLDRDSGAVLGQLGVDGFPGGLAVSGDSLLMLVAADEHGATLESLDPSLHGVRWTRDPSSGRWASSRLYIWRGALLAGSDQGELAALSPSDGKLRWSTRLPGTIRGIGADRDVLYVGTLQGDIYAYAPSLAE